MKFSLSTKPLKAAVNLAIINSNISKFFLRSAMVQLTAYADKLLINTEANQIVSEVELKGVGDGEASIFVDAVQFKALISTLTANQVDLLFGDNNLVIQSGKSKFTLPKMSDNNEGTFRSPELLTDDMINAATVIDHNNWKFIKERQMYAKATTFVEPVYTYVWVGADSDVLVGDEVNGVFTHSEVGQLDMDCLLTDTIINLITSLPENAKIIRTGNTYIIFIDNDSYVYRAQITPMMENAAEGIEYNADIIISIMELSDDVIEVEVDDILTALNQSALLTMDKTPKIDMLVSSNTLHLRDKRIDVEIEAVGEVSDEFAITFKTAALKSVVSSFPSGKLKLCPRRADGDIVGIILHTADLTVALACLVE